MHSIKMYGMHFCGSCTEWCFWCGPSRVAMPLIQAWSSPQMWDMMYSLFTMQLCIYLSHGRRINSADNDTDCFE